jgi:SAM-dependent methyltransferase
MDNNLMALMQQDSQGEVPGAPASDDYYAQARPEMLAFVPETTRRLLDIGCSEGRFGAGVKEKLPGCEVWGVEPSAAAAAAKTRLDRVFSRRFEELEELPDAYFDVVTMNDVLEHLPYSEPALELVRRVLKPDGRLVLSLPNVGYILNVRDLVFRKDWEYQDCGILDRTHLRFFTQKSATRLLTQNGFVVREAKGINPWRLGLPYRILRALAPGFFGEMYFPQFAIVAELAGPKA